MRLSTILYEPNSSKPITALLRQPFPTDSQERRSALTAAKDLVMLTSASSRSETAEHHAQIVCGHFGDYRN
jgi:hypothetical protein